MNTIATIAAGTATRIRASRSERRLGGRRGRLAGGISSSPEAAPARGELLEAFLERPARELRPQLVPEHQLRVRALPQQIVGDSLLPAGADDQIWIVHVRGVQVRAEILLVDSGKGSRRIDDLRPAALVARSEQR